MTAVGLNILLIGIPDAKGLLRFPIEEGEWPGLQLARESIQPGLGLHESFLKKVQTSLSPQIRGVDLRWHTKHKINLDPGAPQLHVCTLDPALWSSPGESLPLRLSLMPDILRNLTNKKAKIAYLRAWQVLMGASDEIILIGGDDPYAEKSASSRKPSNFTETN
jgi:hypothetical protein